MDPIIAFIIMLLGQTSLVTVLVNLLKRVPYAARYPRVTAAVLSVLLAFLASVVLPVPPELQDALVKLLQAVIAALGAVGLHEWVSQPGRSERAK